MLTLSLSLLHCYVDALCAHMICVAVLGVLCTRLKLVQLDVTDEKQIADAYSFVESHVGTEGTYNLYRNVSFLAAVRCFLDN